MTVEYKSENPQVRGIADSFADEFGIEVVEPTRNGVWFETRRHKNGKLRSNTKLLFVTKTALAALLSEVEKLDEAYKSKGVE